MTAGREMKNLLASFLRSSGLNGVNSNRENPINHDDFFTTSNLKIPASIVEYDSAALSDHVYCPYCLLKARRNDADPNQFDSRSENNRRHPDKYLDSVDWILPKLFPGLKKLHDKCINNKILNIALLLLLFF